MPNDSRLRPYAGMDLIRQREMEELVPLPSNSVTGQEDNGLEPIPEIGEEAGTSEVQVEETPQERLDRGTPVSTDVAQRSQKIRAAGTARINALIDIFGEDALVIQHLVFKIPPLSLKIRKQNLNYKWKSLRTRDVTIVPSGSGECYIDIPLVFVGERELKGSLAELIKIFKLAPFAFIENKFIRENMIPDSPEDSMAVCLETLHLNASAGRPDSVNANLTAKWFNYKPYSHHFWFRRDWVPLSTNDEAEEVPVTSQDAARSSLVDLSQIENPENLDLSLPPEARLPSIETDGDPGDMTISPTQPVVYPFNSGAFLSYVNHFNNTHHDGSFDTWNDQMRFRWNSYRRVPWPQNLINVETEGEPVATQTIEDQPSRRERSPNPPAVSGNRDVVLFVGDSITVGYLNVADDSGSLELRDVSGSIRRVFRNHSSFTFYALAKVGANSDTLRGGLTSALNDSDFASRVAGVIVGFGANDGSGSSPNPDTVENMRLVAEAADKIGAVVVMLPIWPISDPVEGDPDYGKTVDFSSEAKASLSTRNNGIRALENALGSNVVFRNTHVSEITTDPNSWGGLWPTTFRQITGSSINVHPNYRVGYATIANVLNGLIPWDSFAGSEPTQALEGVEEYSVLEVLDGDTIRVMGSEGEITVRFNFIDAPETGQAPWGEDSKDYLASIIGDSVRLENTSTDRYGRTLAEVIHAGTGANINKKMVQTGWAVVYTQYASESAQAEYYSLQTTARTSGLNVWRTPGLHQTPWEWRRLNNQPNLEI